MDYPVGRPQDGRVPEGRQEEAGWETPEQVSKVTTVSSGLRKWRATATVGTVVVHEHCRLDGTEDEGGTAAQRLLQSQNLATFGTALLAVGQCAHNDVPRVRLNYDEVQGIDAPLSPTEPILTGCAAANLYFGNRWLVKTIPKSPLLLCATNSPWEI